MSNDIKYWSWFNKNDWDTFSKQQWKNYKKGPLGQYIVEVTDCTAAGAVESDALKMNNNDE